MKQFGLIIFTCFLAPLAVAQSDIRNEIPTLCLAPVLLPHAVAKVENHPQYETVTEQVLIREGTTVYKSIPAEYETVTETIEVTPETEIAPATSRVITKQVLVRPAELIEEEIPPLYETITYEKPVVGSRALPELSETDVTWQPVLCEDQLSAQWVQTLQAELRRAGYPAPQGSFGEETISALQAFQKDRGLSVGGLTIESLYALGIVVQ